MSHLPFSEWENAAEVPGICTRKIHVKAIMPLVHWGTDPVQRMLCRVKQVK